MVSDNLDLIKTLIEHGADVNARSNNEDTPLVEASYNSNNNSKAC